MILSAFGSPDLRQIDGMGGANTSTSKVAIIKKSDREGVDVDYDFGQVSVDNTRSSVLWAPSPSTRAWFGRLSLSPRCVFSTPTPIK